MKYSVAPVLEYYGGQVTHRGGYSKMLCPFHADSSPSASVNHSRQSFKCWVCDFGGDAIDIIRWRDGGSYEDAKRKAAQITGESDGEISDGSGDGPDLFGRTRVHRRNGEGGEAWRRNFT